MFPGASCFCLNIPPLHSITECFCLLFLCQYAVSVLNQGHLSVWMEEETGLCYADTPQPYLFMRRFVLGADCHPCYPALWPTSHGPGNLIERFKWTGNAASFGCQKIPGFEKKKQQTNPTSESTISS